MGASYLSWAKLFSLPIIPPVSCRLQPARERLDFLSNYRKPVLASSHRPGKKILCSRGFALPSSCITLSRAVSWSRVYIFSTSSIPRVRYVRIQRDTERLIICQNIWGSEQWKFSSVDKTDMKDIRAPSSRSNLSNFDDEKKLCTLIVCFRRYLLYLISRCRWVSSTSDVLF